MTRVVVLTKSWNLWNTQVKSIFSILQIKLFPNLENVLFSRFYKSINCSRLVICFIDVLYTRFHCKLTIGK